MARSLEPAAVHHRTPIVAVTGYIEIPDKPRQKGGALFLFRDERGIRVTLQLHHTAIDSLKEALRAGPTPAKE